MTKFIQKLTSLSVALRWNEFLSACPPRAFEPSSINDLIHLIPHWLNDSLKNSYVYDVSMEERIGQQNVHRYKFVMFGMPNPDLILSFDITMQSGIKDSSRYDDVKVMLLKIILNIEKNKELDLNQQIPIDIQNNNYNNYNNNNEKNLFTMCGMSISGITWGSFDLDVYQDDLLHSLGPSKQNNFFKSFHEALLLLCSLYKMNMLKISFIFVVENSINVFNII